MNTSIDNLNILKELIKRLADDTYSREQKGMLLSRVGESIAKLPPDVRDALGNRKLAEFIQEELGDSVRVHTSPNNSIVKIILPTHVQVNGNLVDFIPVRTNTKNLTEHAPRYSRAFWAAFSHPLPAGHTRVIVLDPQVNFEDISSAPPQLEPNKKALPADLITDETVESNPVKRVQLINEKIKQWLQDNEVDIDTVLAKAEIGHASALKIASLQRRSMLEILLGALDDTELRRIQMPLDIVAKLNRHIE